jgi:DNA polymerase I
MNERMAINAPVQGTGADITKLAMIKVSEYLEKENLLDQVSLLLQVHDELVFEIPIELVEKISPEIKKRMENVIPLEKTKNVVCKVEYKVGENWGEMK